MMSLVFFIVLVFISYIECQEWHTVVTDLGTIRGSILRTRRNRTIFSFRGIPYAETTAGHMRFRPPRPISSYNGTYDATEDGPICSQPLVIPGTPSFMSEDCLRVSVYTPRLPTTSNPAMLLPVVVFIPGGAFIGGGGASTINGPEYILDRECVLVALNYRVGPLGFLSTGTPEAPGNNGLKDQVVALKWIRRYIALFGGDPNQVTITGNSAGAISVALHILSPMSVGLFKAAIISSGTPTSQIPISTNQWTLVQRLATMVSCDNSTASSMLSCLRTVSDVKIINTFFQFVEFGSSDPVLTWSPVVENDFGQDNFLSKNPNDILRNGEFHPVPIMIGITTIEMGATAFEVLQDDNLRTRMDEDWNVIAPIAFMYERNTERSMEISRYLRQFYLGSGPLVNNNATFAGLCQLYADARIGFGVHRYANIMAQVSREPVYYYRFSYRGRFSNAINPITGQPFGVAHSDDLLYVLPSLTGSQHIGLNDPETNMVDIMSTLWVNFATYGNPTPTLKDTGALGQTMWPRLDECYSLYLDIGTPVEVRSRLYAYRFQVWDRLLFPLRTTDHRVRAYRGSTPI